MEMIRMTMPIAIAALVLGLGAADAQPPAPAESVRVGVLTDGTSEYWVAFQNAAMKEAETVGVTLDFRALSPSTAEQQRLTVSEMIAAGAKALAICPVDPAQQKASLQEIAAKIPLVLLNRDVADCGRACFIGTDEKDIGKKFAELVSKLLPGGLKIAALIKTGESAAERARMEGFKEGLAPEGYIVDAVKADKGDRNLAWAGADELMGKRVELAAYVAFEPYQMPALLRAATGRKMDGIINLIGFVETTDMQEAFVKGRIQGAVRIDAGAGAKQAMAVLHGLATQDPAFKLPEKGVIDIAPLIETTPRQMTPQEKMDVLQVPRVSQETPAPPPAPARPSFE
jgi:ribose transport system substrate-binding protein